MCGPERFGGVVGRGGELIFMGLSLRAARGIIIIIRLCWPLSHRVDTGGRKKGGNRGKGGVYGGFERDQGVVRFLYISLRILVSCT